MYYYFKATEEDYVVGYHCVDGSLEIEGDYPSREKAAARVHYLNGGDDIALASKICDNLSYVLLSIHATLQRLLPGAKNG